MWRFACALLVVSASLIAADADKRAEIPVPVPFLLGSRYGRSPPRMLAPRNDRYDAFFMGSRYGKRSAAHAGDSSRAGGKHAGGTHAALAGSLLCDFTGVSSLYRCVQTANRYNNRQTDESRVTKEE